MNCLGVMGGGIALELSKNYPKVKRKYTKKCKGQLPEELLGQVQYVGVTESLAVVNSFTQLSVGFGDKQTDEELLIRNIIDVCNTNNDVEVFVPHLIGCGLAGGDWSTIFEGIKHLNNLTIVKLSDDEKRKRGLVI